MQFFLCLFVKLDAHISIKSEHNSVKLLGHSEQENKDMYFYPHRVGRQSSHAAFMCILDVSNAWFSHIQLLIGGK